MERIIFGRVTNDSTSKALVNEPADASMMGTSIREGRDACGGFQMLRRRRLGPWGGPSRPD